MYGSFPRVWREDYEKPLVAGFEFLRAAVLLFGQSEKYRLRGNRLDAALGLPEEMAARDIDDLQAGVSMGAELGEAAAPELKDQRRHDRFSTESRVEREPNVRYLPLAFLGSG